MRISLSILFAAAAASACSHTSAVAPSMDAAANDASVDGGQLSKPAIPASGAYLGAWLNPSDKFSDGGISGPATLAAMDAYLGRPLGVNQDFVGWSDQVDVASLTDQATSGTTPMVDWHCGDSGTNITAGNDDALIKAMADRLKSVGHPLFLRYYWEMEFLTDPQTTACRPGGASAYVSAWQRIWNIFQQEGATNVAFVWCPGGNNLSLALTYYPGDQYVDWIAVDDYALSSNNSFAAIMQPFYDMFSAHPQPLMIAETGALPGYQATFLDGAATALQAQMPRIKAVLYLDGSGPRGDWALDANGLLEFKMLASSAQFSGL